MSLYPVAEKALADEDTVINKIYLCPLWAYSLMGEIDYEILNNKKINKNL